MIGWRSSGVLLLVAAPLCAATPKNPFDQSPLISTQTPSVELRLAHIPNGAVPADLDIVALNGHAAENWAVADTRDPALPHMLAYGSAHAAPAPEANELSFGDSDTGADKLSWSVAFPKQPAVSAGDVSLSIKIASSADSRAGLVYRYQDPSNYDFLEVDPVGEFCTVYRVQKGKWKRVSRISAVLTADTWHLVRFIFQHDTFAVFIDGELALGGRDKSGPDSGRVGVAVSADGSANVRQFVVRPPAAVPMPATSTLSH